MAVLAANNWKTNGDLILDVHRLGYLKLSDYVLDPTYGKGIWWKKYRPANFVYHDLKPDLISFTDLPYVDDFFDVTAFDPPYVSKGGRDTSGLVAFDDAYGLRDAPGSPQELHGLICTGLNECIRVSRRYVLVKACNYISSGHYWPGVFEIQKYVDSLGLSIVDQFMHYSVSPRPQPKRTRKDGKPSVQKHARNNYSVLMIVKV
jgi:hypothetical protein